MTLPRPFSVLTTIALIIPAISSEMAIALPAGLGETVPQSETLQPSLEVAQQYVPPDDRGVPGRREGGGTRGGMIISGAPPTALIPTSNLGITLSDRPTFFFYVPAEAGGLPAEFLLFDDQENEIYQTLVTLPEEEGIIGISLPEILPALEPGQNYRWFFAIIVDSSDRAGDLFLEGLVSRMEPSPEMQERLQAATPEQLPILYAESGIWYDALMQLATVRQTNPNDSTAMGQWMTLLESVDLGAIADKPLLGIFPPLAPTPAPTPVPDASERLTPEAASTLPIENQGFQPPDIRLQPRREGGGTR